MRSTTLVYGKQESVTICWLLDIVKFSNHYFCTVYAARMMAPRKQGLIVVISSAGGLRYLFNVAYGVGKAAVCFSFFCFSLDDWQFENFSVIVWPLTPDLN